jgi:hypothetical protein
MARVGPGPAQNKTENPIAIITLRDTDSDPESRVRTLPVPSESKQRASLLAPAAVDHI